MNEGVFPSNKQVPHLLLNITYRRRQNGDLTSDAALHQFGFVLVRRLIMLMPWNAFAAIKIPSIKFLLCKNV
jgi:hypothetical protein